jgi:hypothetical protein
MNAKFLADAKRRESVFDFQTAQAAGLAGVARAPA